MAETRGNGEKMKEKYGLRFKNQFPVKQRGGALKGVGEVCSVRFGSFCAYKPGLLTSKRARVFLDKVGVTVRVRRAEQDGGRAGPGCGLSTKESHFFGQDKRKGILVIAALMGHLPP